MPTNPLLRLSEVHRHFGGVKAVDGVSLVIPEGTIFGLIGPNGAGKTTLVNLVTGYLPATSGRIELSAPGGAAPFQLAGRPAHRVAQLGVARTFQSIRLFRGLSALDNVLAGMHPHRRSDLLTQLVPGALLGGGRRRRAAEAERLLERVGLDPARFGKRPASTLAYGDQRRLEIARALALRPRLLILDEPAAGMNPSEKVRVRELIESLHADGLTILLIEHDMRLVMGACQRVAVLNFGRKIADGAPAEVSRDEQVITAYLGSREERATATAVAAAAGAGRETAEPAGRRPLLEVKDLHVSYGPVSAVRGVSFEVRLGEVVALIGANGAGKSTVLNTLSGIVRPRSGAAVFDGLDLTSAPPSRIVRHGLVQVPEGREVLARQTVRENLELAAWTRRDRRSAARQIDALMERFPILGERRDLPAGQLSGGEQQMLAIARGLVARPRLLLLDEPSLGLAPQMVDAVFDVIRQIHEQGTTVLLVEQNALRALEIAQRAYVVETGQIVLTGSGAELLADPEVQRAYLGG